MPTLLAGIEQDITLAFHASETLTSGTPTSMGFRLARDETGAPAYAAVDDAPRNLVAQVQAAGFNIDPETLEITFLKTAWDGPFGAYEERPGQNRPAIGTDIDFRSRSPILGWKYYQLSTKVKTGTGISFDGAAETCSDSANGLAEFKTGDTVVITGSTSNNGTYVISSGGVAGSFTTSGDFTTEAAGANITIRMQRGVIADYAVFGSAVYVMDLSTTHRGIYKVTNWGTPGDAYLVRVYQHPTAACAFTRFHVHNGYIYACAGTTAAYVYSTDGDTWTPSTRGGTDQQATQMTTMNGILHKRLGQNHYQLSAQTSTGINGGEDWASADQIGDSSYALNEMFGMADGLVFPADNGVFTIDGNGNQQELLPELQQAARVGNGVGSAVWNNNALLYPTRDGGVILYSSGGSEQIAPAGQVEFPFEVGMSSPPIGQYIATISPTPDYVYAFQAPSGGYNRLFSLEMDPKLGPIWRSQQLTLQATGITKIWIIQDGAGAPVLWCDSSNQQDTSYYIIPKGNPLLDSRTRFLASGIIYDPWLTMGCPETTKRWSHIEVGVTESTPANFAKDTYTLDAYNEAGSDVITTNSLTLAQGPTIGTINFNANVLSRRVRLMHTLGNTGTNQELESPILLWIRVHAFARPTPQMRFKMGLDIAAAGVGEGSATQVEARAFLNDMRAHKLPMTFTDMYGTAWTVNAAIAQTGESSKRKRYLDYDEVYEITLVQQAAGV